MENLLLLLLFRGFWAFHTTIRDLLEQGVSVEQKENTAGILSSPVN